MIPFDNDDDGGGDCVDFGMILSYAPALLVYGTQYVATYPRGVCVAF